MTTQGGLGREQEEEEEEEEEGGEEGPVAPEEEGEVVGEEEGGEEGDKKEDRILKGATVRWVCDVHMYSHYIYTEFSIISCTH